VTTKASIAGGKLPVETTLLRASDALFFALFDVICPASSRSAMSSSRVTSATNHPSFRASKTSNCARNPCASASARASAVGANSVPKRHNFTDEDEEDEEDDDDDDDDDEASTSTVKFSRDVMSSTRVAHRPEPEPSSPSPPPHLKSFAIPR
jgi:hypothetical protein